MHRFFLIGELYMIAFDYPKVEKILELYFLYNKYRTYLYIMHVCVNKYSYDLESSASNNV